jgi:AcrR family transcriptional regulator
MQLTATRPEAAREVDARGILDAAWTVLARSRYRSLKIRQVLVASNSSASNFYRLFPSKSHLLLALLKDETERADRRLGAKLAAAGSVEAQLRTWLAFSIRSVYRAEYAERLRLFLDPTLLDELPDQVRELHDVMGNRLITIIERGVADGRFATTDSHADAAMIQNLLRGLIARGLVGQFDGSEHDVVDLATGFVLRALGGAEPV